MQNFIQVESGAYVSINSITLAEKYDDSLMRISTPAGHFLVKKTDFLKLTNVKPPVKKARVTK